MAHTVAIAPGITAIVRDWLNANHALIEGDGNSVLVDTGCSMHARNTVELVRAASATGSVGRIVNTHCHSDHMGGNATLSRAFDAPIALPADAAPLIDRWDQRELLLGYADQSADRFDYVSTISGGEEVELGGMRWQALAAPGHDMSALVFYSPEHRVLISGDALWESSFGIVEPLDRLDERLGAQRATLLAIAGLDVRTVIPGHGAPFGDVRAALDRAFQRLDAYERDPLKLARHCLKAFFMFSLLGRGRLARKDLGAYFERVPCYREYNARFFNLAPEALAEMLTGELVRAGVVVVRDGDLVPA